MVIQRAEVIRVLSDLVRIESVNPELVPGGSGEAAIAHYVAGFLKAAGLEVRLQEVGKNRFNILGTLRGHGGGKTLLLNGHLDTVGVAGMAEPFSARVENDRLYGRGAQDMKGGLAAALIAAAALAREPALKGDLVITAVADEEYRSAGTRAVLREGMKADAAVVLEPTGLAVATAHKGFVWAEIETEGCAAHGSRPEEGVDAIARMGRVLGEVEQLQERLKAKPCHPRLGWGSVHASLISGGQELSSYPERCRLSLERRLVPGEDAKAFEAELSDILARLSAADPRFRAHLSPGYSARPWESPEDSLIVSTLAACVRHVLEREARFGATTFWTDAALLDEAGIPSVVFGPGGEGLHSAVEYVRLDEVVQGAETLVDCGRVFCGA